MSNLNLRTHDLIIKDVTDRDGNEVEAVNIKWGLATDEVFVQECKDSGVNKYVPDEEQEEEEEE